MAAVQNLCNKAIVLKGGNIDFPMGDVSQGIRHYIRQSFTLARQSLAQRSDREGEGLARFSSIVITDAHGSEITATHTGDDVRFEVKIDAADKVIHNLGVAITIYSEEGAEMFTLANHIAADPFAKVMAEQSMVCRVARLPLTRGEYVANISMYKDGILQDYIREAFSLQVHDGDYYGTGRTLPGDDPRVLIDQEWQLK
jgi:lipopolysaccharide transport system ATP-binding protein